MKKNQKGFSVIEGLIILVVIGAIGFGGWYVYDSRKSEDKNNTTSESKKANDDKHEEAADAVKLTTELVSHNNKFSIFLPDGWVVTNDTELDYALAVGLDNMTYKSGEPAKVVDEMGHRGGGLTTSNFVVQYGNTSELENYFSASEELGAFKTDSGLEGKRYLFAPKESNDETGAIAGSKTYGYKFTDDNKTIIAAYMVLETDPDQLEIVEDSVKTLKFL